MFKKYLSSIFLFLFIFLISGCTTTPVESVEQVMTHKTPALTQLQVFNKTREWFTKYFINEESKLDYENSESGVITGSGIIHLGGVMVDQSALYTIKIAAKDNEFNASTKVLEFRNSDINGSYVATEVNQARIKQTNEKIAEVVMSLAKYVKASAVNDSN